MSAASGAEPPRPATEQLSASSALAVERLQAAFGGPEAVEVIAERLGKSRESVALTLSYMFSGPCPPPEMLKAYEEVLPGLADRLVRQAEGQTAHRQQMERDNLAMEREEHREALAQSRLGLWLGFAVVVLVFCVVMGALALGHPLVAGSLGVADLAVLVGVFVYGSRTGRGNPSGSPESPDGKSAPKDDQGPS